MKILCSLSCNSTAACAVFIAVDAIAGNAPTWTLSQVSVGLVCAALTLTTAIYRERRLQRTQLSIWRRSQVLPQVA